MRWIFLPEWKCSHSDGAKRWVTLGKVVNYSLPRHPGSSRGVLWWQHLLLLRVCSVWVSLGQLPKAYCRGT